MTTWSVWGNSSDKVISPSMHSTKEEAIEFAKSRVPSNGLMAVAEATFEGTALVSHHPDGLLPEGAGA